jgi:hypothetical protein
MFNGRILISRPEFVVFIRFFLNKNRNFGNVFRKKSG